MKFAIVSPVPLFPTNTGNRARILALVRALRSLGHEVHYIQLDIWDWETGDAATAADEIGTDRLHILQGCAPALASSFSRAWRGAAARLRLPFAYRYGLDGWFDPRLLPRLAAIDARERLDAVIVEYVFLSRAFDAFAPRAARLLDTHDAFGERWKMLRRAGVRPYWYATSLDAEARGLDRADMVLAIQEEEASAFRARARSPVAVVSHIAAIDRRPLAHRPAAAFLASSNHLNAAALDWFVGAVLPRVLARRPDFRLFLGGTIASKAPAHPALVPLGFVEDLHALFAAAPIAINPVQGGSGINIKLLDARAAGIPVVTTRTGARGLGEASDGCTIVADRDADAFAQALLALLDDPPLWARQRKAAFAAAEAWNARQIEALDGAIGLARSAAARR